MVDVTAYQLLYSRVEASAFKEIPNAGIKRSGYQVVFHSQAIADDVAVIEKRVQCFQPKDEAAIRYQFFTTESSKVVVTQSLRITADPVITDQNERPGAFIAHCLVFTQSEFAKLSNDPFKLIFDESRRKSDPDRDIFIDDPHDLLDVVRQNEETVKLRVSRGASNPSQLGQNRSEFAKLVRLARSGLTDQTLGFIGDSADIEDTLENLITLVDRRNRLYVTFDTLIDGCNPVPGQYFAVGTSRRIPNSRFVNIDLSNPTIKIESKDQKKETGYSNWLKHSLAHDPIETTLTHAAQVQHINEAFENGVLIGSEELDPVAVDGFLQLNRDLIMERFKAALANHFSASIVDALLEDHAQGRLEYLRHADIIDVAAQEGFAGDNQKQLALELYAWLLRHQPESVNGGDWQAMGKIADTTKHLPLMVAVTLNQMQGITLTKVVKLFGQKTDAEKRRDQLVAHLVQADKLHTVLHNLAPFDWGQPHYFVTEKSAQQIVAYLVRADAPPVSTDELAEIIIALLHASSGKHLGQLSDRLRAFDDKTLKRIQKQMTKAQGQVDKSFQKQVNDLIKKQ
jgi:hypothetical protein